MVGAKVIAGRLSGRLVVAHEEGWVSAPFPGGVAHARGFAFRGLDRIDARALADEARHITSGPEVSAYLRRLNGHFALVVEGDQSLWAAVDPLRSIPLFYRRHGSSVLLSDSANLLLRRDEPLALDQTAAAAVLKAGYTLGDATLYPDVKELQAGQFLVVSSEDVSARFYYQHIHTPRALEFATIMDDLDAVSKNVFSRLINSLGGRTCVIPLSGGYDSRYIATMLRRCGYTSVICYSYGAEGSDEVVTSQRVAAALGYPWFSVKYTPEKWRAYLESEDAALYELECGNGSAIPHVQEYIALNELVQSGKLPEDAVVVPGFSGDLLGGSYVPPEVASPLASELLRAGLGDYISKTHLSFSQAVSPAMMETLRERIQDTLSEYPPVETIEDFVSVHEAWFTVHKVAKFVVNSLRVYEHFGFEWLMPLWDRELCDFWYTVPLQYRQHSELYESYLFERVFEPLSVGFRKAPPLGDSAPIKILHSFLPEAWYAALRRVHGKVKLRYWPPDPNGFLTLAEFLRKDLLEAQGLKVPRAHNVNEVIAPYFLSRLPLLLSSFSAS